jgi:hypothetical protein
VPVFTPGRTSYFISFLLEMLQWFVEAWCSLYSSPILHLIGVINLLEIIYLWAQTLIILPRTRGGLRELYNETWIAISYRINSLLEITTTTVHNHYREHHSTDSSWILLADLFFDWSRPLTGTDWLTDWMTVLFQLTAATRWQNWN